MKIDPTVRAKAIYEKLMREKYIPRVRAAEEEAAMRRAEDFVDAPRQVGPWLLRPMTLRDVLIAEGYESPLLAPSATALQLATPIKLCWFAWLLQPPEVRADDEAREAFIAAAAVRHVEHERRRRWWGGLRATRTERPTEAYFADLAAVVEFVGRHYADAHFARVLDAETGRPRPARDTGTHWIAGIVDSLAAEYGWREEDILGLHLGRIWQYLRRIEGRRRPGALVPTDTKKIEAECTAEAEAILRAELAAPDPAEPPTQ